MRARGAEVTDIAVLVVAADDARDLDAADRRRRHVVELLATLLLRLPAAPGRAARTPEGTRRSTTPGTTTATGATAAGTTWATAGSQATEVTAATATFWTTSAAGSAPGTATGRRRDHPCADRDRRGHWDNPRAGPERPLPTPGDGRAGVSARVGARAAGPRGPPSRLSGGRVVPPGRGMPVVPPEE